MEVDDGKLRWSSGYFFPSMCRKSKMMAVVLLRMALAKSDNAERHKAATHGLLDKPETQVWRGNRRHSTQSRH
jgi:hypothetical protein